MSGGFFAGFLFLLNLVLLSSVSLPAFACSTPSQYIITIERLELKDTRGQWITVMEPDTHVDMMKQEPAISFFNNGKIPDGRYVNFRLWIADTIRVAGSDGGFSTKQGGYVVVRSDENDLTKFSRSRLRFEPLAASVSNGRAGLMQVEFKSGNTQMQSSLQLFAQKDMEAVLIGKGIFVSVSFLLDFSQGVCYASKSELEQSTKREPFMYALSPASAQKVVLTVGQASKTFQSEELSLTLR